MTGVAIRGLGYVGLRTRELEPWRRFATELLGLQAVQQSRASLSLRMDEMRSRLLLHEGTADEPDFYGWEVADADALDAIAARLDAAGHAVAPLARVLAEQRGVDAAIVTSDPAGNCLEFFHGQERAETPFMPGRPLSGFRTGALGMGHLVLNVDDVEQILPYYRDVLGFRLSDYTLRPFKAYFLHSNTRHHSLALIENRRRGLHHLMLEVRGIDDLGQAYDLAQLEPCRVATTLGRHSNDHMTSFYLRTPSEFLIEYGWGGRDIDPVSWQACELQLGPSLWGHERDWVSEELRQEARRLRLLTAARGVRAPLQLPLE